MGKGVFCFLSFVLLTLSMARPAESQTRPGPPPNVSSSPQPPETITRPDSVADSGLYGFWSQMTNQGRAGGALLGKVQVEGQSLLWEPVLVSIICHEKVVNTARADPKGNFVFNTVRGVVTAQADVEREMKMYYEGCKVEALLPGFHSDALTITERNLRDEPELGTIWLHLNGRAMGTALSTRSGAVPKNAEKLFEEAHAAMLAQNPGRAQSDLEKAVRLYPEFAEAWFQLGKLQMSSNAQSARESFSKALTGDPRFILPYEGLAQLAVQEEKWSEVQANTSRALQLGPSGTPRIWYFDALANYQAVKLDAAKASALKALAMDPQHQIPNTEQLLAVILARQGDYEGALQHLRNCLAYVTTGPNVEFLKQQIGQLERAVQQSKARRN
jgi:tetratricopeptide (TPR) repeat protein